MRARLMLSCAVVVVGAGLSLGGGNAFGYAGEQGTVGAGVTPATVSTHHLHLTRALAYCAGFDADINISNPVDPVISHTAAKDAEIIGIYDELTDQGTIKDATTTWSNINPNWSYSYPPKETEACRTADRVMVFPIVTTPPRPAVLPADWPEFPADTLWDPTKGWFTNRFGPWAGQFHFPTPEDLTKAHDFAMTKSSSQILSARTVYGFGQPGSNMWTGNCYTDPYRTDVNTGMDSGSLQALAIYLHSLGDSYSHGVCSGNWPYPQNPQWTPPWVYHTVAGTPKQVAGCAFNSHSLEFGCPDGVKDPFLKNVVDGGIEVFARLLEYRGKNATTPARLTSATAHQNWLRRQLERYATLFKTNTNEEGGKCRVSFAWELMKLCAKAASTPADSCLDDVPLTGCDPAGMAACPKPSSSFVFTPACTMPATATR